MSTNTPSAGGKLRRDLDAALIHASQEAGRALEFDEAERRAVVSADGTLTFEVDDGSRWLAEHGL